MSHLKPYIGVKRVYAEPKERNGKPGYRVIYAPDGYESWSPKETFEAAYLSITQPNCLTDNDIDNFINASDIHVEKRGEKSTLVEIKLPTGWMDHEVSSCVDSKNYDEELGKQFALENIKHRLWKHLGFVLQWAHHGLKKD